MDGETNGHTKVGRPKGSLARKRINPERIKPLSVGDMKLRVDTAKETLIEVFGDKVGEVRLVSELSISDLLRVLADRLEGI
jgi:hypothetical protein